MIGAGSDLEENRYRLEALDRLPAALGHTVGVAGMEAHHGAYGFYTFQGQDIGGDVGGYSVALGDGDYPTHGVLNA